MQVQNVIKALTEWGTQVNNHPDKILVIRKDEIRVEDRPGWLTKAKEIFLSKKDRPIRDIHTIGENIYTVIKNDVNKINTVKNLDEVQSILASLKNKDMKHHANSKFNNVIEIIKAQTSGSLPPSLKERRVVKVEETTDSFQAAIDKAASLKNTQVQGSDKVKAENKPETKIVDTKKTVSSVNPEKQTAVNDIKDRLSKRLFAKLEAGKYEQEKLTLEDPSTIVLNFVHKEIFGKREHYVIDVKSGIERFSKLSDGQKDQIINHIVNKIRKENNLNLSDEIKNVIG